MKEQLTYTRFTYNDQHLIFNTPNDMCLWRVKTLLTKEPETIKWLETLTEDDVLWDVGANIGLYTIFAAKLQRCKVYAFEPESQNYVILNRSIGVNRLTNASAYCIAVGDNDHSGELSLSSFESGHSGHSTNGKRAAFKQGTIIHTLDSLVKIGIPKPTHLKVDVDGLDPEVIVGGPKTMSTIKSVLIELDTSTSKHREVIEMMANYGLFFDPLQVEKTAREKGTAFEHFREFIFTRY